MYSEELLAPRPTPKLENHPFFGCPRLELNILLLLPSVSSGRVVVTGTYLSPQGFVYSCENLLLPQGRAFCLDHNGCLKINFPRHFLDSKISGALDVWWLFVVAVAIGTKH